NEIQIGRGKSRLGEAVFDGPLRKALVVLFARESLFLGGGYDSTINNQSRCRVVIIGRNAEDRGHVCRQYRFRPSWSVMGVGALQALRMLGGQALRSLNARTLQDATVICSTAVLSQSISDAPLHLEDFSVGPAGRSLEQQDQIHRLQKRPVRRDRKGN